MKCNFTCMYYVVDIQHSGRYVACSRCGYTIADIKDKLPDRYNNCPYYRKGNNT